MTANGWLQIALYSVVLLALTKPMGVYMVKVYDGSMGWLRPVERFLYRVARIDPEEDQHWTMYTAAMLLFSAVSMLLTYLVLRLQHVLPLNPQKFAAVVDRQAFETAASFSTNTNWQSYVGESTMSYFSQMNQLAFHNFVSAAAGVAVAVALARGIARRSAGRLGNFWADLVRGTLYIFIPLSFVVALIQVQQGSIQNFLPYVDIHTLEGAKQTIAMGPVASQEAIKELGTNGGGFFNANSAHPFENPTALTNLVEIFLLLAIPFSLPRTYGLLVGDKRQGWAVFGFMATLWGLMVAVVTWAEVSAGSGPLGGLEGKEVRFGVWPSALFAASTTGTSTGAVNSMHESYSPLGGGGALFSILLGEVSPGGVGSGLYGALLLAILTVFISGLMVGRTPELLGKQVGRREITVTALALLVMPALVLVFTGIGMVAPLVSSQMLASGPHGLTEVMYAYASAANNNGSAFAGFSADTPYTNLTLALCMLLGRFVPIVLVLALAGSLVAQRRRPVTAGTLPTHTPTFAGLFLGVAVIVTGLTFFPALALGPLAEALS